MARYPKTRIHRGSRNRESHFYTPEIRRDFTHTNPLGAESDPAADRKHARRQNYPLPSPYGIDHQPEYAEEVAQLPLAQEMGYLIVGQRIDPDDWSLRGGKPIPAREIVDSVLRQADNGNIILLHDGGGDRTQTVAALPQIIDVLREKGYQLVSVSDLIGKTRAEVMPTLSPEERFEARADGFIFTLFQWFRFLIGAVFVLGIR